MPPVCPRVTAVRVQAFVLHRTNAHEVEPLRANATSKELRRRHAPEIDISLSGSSGPAAGSSGKRPFEPRRHIFSYLKAGGTDGRANADNQLRGVAAKAFFHSRDERRADAAERAAPAGMRQPDGAMNGIDDIKRHAIGMTGHERNGRIIRNERIAWGSGGRVYRMHVGCGRPGARSRHAHMYP